MGGRSVVPLLYASRAGAARMARGKYIAAVRPQVAAAIRIPDRVSAQLRLVFPSASPRLFVHEGARQALERRLTTAFVGTVLLSITDNRHSIITHRIKRGILHARVHHMFLDAPAYVMDALVRYVTRDDRDASAILGDYIDANGFRVVRRKRNAPLMTKGRNHDLLTLFNDLNERYFDGGVSALITWGKPPVKSAAARKTIKPRELQPGRQADPRAPFARSKMGAPLLRRLHRLPRDAPPRDPGEPRPRPREPASARVQGEGARVPALRSRHRLGEAPRRPASALLRRAPSSPARHGVRAVAGCGTGVGRAVRRDIRDGLGRLPC